MHEECHRCYGELWASTRAGQQAPLFCPHCSAPQVWLPDFMREERDRAAQALASGATPPPPRPSASLRGEVDWPSAIASAALVAAVCALFTAVGLAFTPVAVLGRLWVMGGAVVAVALYSRRRPLARLDARLGLRIGLVTGVLLAAALGLTLAAGGMVARFATHRMGGLDAGLSQQFALVQDQLKTQLHQQGQDPAIQQKVLGFMSSEEVRGGLVVAYLGVLACLVLLLSSGGGAFAGMLRASRRAPRSTD